MTTNTVWTIKTFPGGGTTTFGGGTPGKAISGGATPNTVAERRSGPFRLSLITSHGQVNEVG